MPTTEELAYAAGLLDGEGTVTMSYHKKRDLFRVPMVSMSSTTYELLDFMRETFGGYVSAHKTYQEHHRKSYSWKLSYDAALNFLEAVHPYMREPVKKARATLLLSSYKKITLRNGRYTKAQEKHKFDFEDAFFAIAPAA